MTLTNETQTIDADALRARLADAPADLRGRIEAALRARHGNDATVHLGPAPDGVSGRDAVVFVMGGYVAARADDEGAALRGLARLMGLDADGSDPHAEVERLQRERDALQDAAREYLAACDACEEAVDAFRANVAKGDADAARESMRAGAVTIQRGDAARARLAALAGGAS